MLKMQDISKIYRTDLIETYALRALRIDQFGGCFDNAPFGRRPSRCQSALSRLCVSTHRLCTLKMDWTVHFGYRMSGLISPDIGMHP